MSRKNGNDEGVIGCLAFVLIAIIAMPLLGLYLLSQPSDQDKSIGLVLLIVDIILWIIFFSVGGR